ncbi:MAG: globin domain-containing protein [Saprospiraceae bacterium]
MTSAQINLVKKSWNLLRLVSPALVADVFYSKLFHKHPELRAMFPTNMEDQYQKLIDMLSSMIARLDRLEGYEQNIVDLAKRHEGYGVVPKHYEMVGEALQTLEKASATTGTKKPPPPGKPVMPWSQKKCSGVYDGVNVVRLNYTWKE